MKKTNKAARKLLSLLHTLFCFVAGTAAAFVLSNHVSHLTQKSAYILEPKVELVDYQPEDESVLPGEARHYAPYIKNTGEANIYAVIAFSCKCYDKGTVEMMDEYESDEDPIPAYVLNINDGWEIKDSSVENGEIMYFYAYSKAIAPGESTPPLCDDILFNLFSYAEFSTMDDPDVGFSMAYHAGNSDTTSLDGVVVMAKSRE